jgi:hypothetical protein
MESCVSTIHTPVHAPVDQERVTASAYAPLADISKGKGALLSYRFSLLSPTPPLKLNLPIFLLP